MSYRRRAIRIFAVTALAMAAFRVPPARAVQVGCQVCVPYPIEECPVQELCGSCGLVQDCAPADETECQGTWLFCG